MSLLSLLINLMHPCWIKVLISLISFQKKSLTDPKLLNSICYRIFIFQINAVRFKFLFIIESWKIFFTQLFNTDNVFWGKKKAYCYIVTLKTGVMMLKILLYIHIIIYLFLQWGGWDSSCSSTDKHHKVIWNLSRDNTSEVVETSKTGSPVSPLKITFLGEPVKTNK